MSAAGRIMKNSVDAGGAGFAIAPRTVLTAAHVVDGVPAASLSFSLAGATPVRVADYRTDEELDIAVLQLRADVRETVPVGLIDRRQRWIVDTQTLENDPVLTGEVTLTGHRIGRGDMSTHKSHSSSSISGCSTTPATREAQ